MDSADPSEGDEFRLFDADEMLGYLEELDAQLELEGASEAVHLYIAGGAVMATKSANRVTQDVDVVSEGMTNGLRRAVGQVSSRNEGLRRDWLNDGAKLKRVSIPMEASRIFSGRVLTVDSAGSRYILAMKLVAGRPVDEDDCELLIRELGIREESELLDLIEQAIPERLRRPGMEYFAMARLANARKGKWRQRLKEWRSRRASRKRDPAAPRWNETTARRLVCAGGSRQSGTVNPRQPAGSVNVRLPSGGRCRNPRPTGGRCAAGHRPS